MPRRRHPKKEVEAALREAEATGWRITMSASGHGWGVMWCPEQSREGCRRSISSTPRNPGNHAAHLLQGMRGCPHTTSRGD
ncbi:MAG: hypothetical protein OXE43_05025 [Chloroflexi bacterium]|nr:hypothetical protein [Chloroflexota bacterium]